MKKNSWLIGIAILLVGLSGCAGTAGSGSGSVEVLAWAAAPEEPVDPPEPTEALPPESAAMAPEHLPHCEWEYTWRCTCAEIPESPFTHEEPESAFAEQMTVAPPPDADTESDWRFFVAIYGWLANISGRVAQGDEDVDVTVPFSDFAKAAKGGFMMYAEVRWKKWFLGFDGTWATLGMEEEGRLLDIDVTLDQKIFDLRLGYEVYRAEYGEVTGPDDWQRSAVFDVYIGARYWYTKPTVTIRPAVGDKRQFSFTSERWDPFIGIRAHYDISKLFGLGLRGDIGGFGIGESAQLTWQLQATLSFRLSKLFVLFAGFRAMKFDTIEGTGDERGGTDMTQYGPLIGAGFIF